MPRTFSEHFFSDHLRLWLAIALMLILFAMPRPAGSAAITGTATATVLPASAMLSTASGLSIRSPSAYQLAVQRTAVGGTFIEMRY